MAKDSSVGRGRMWCYGVGCIRTGLDVTVGYTVGLGRTVRQGRMWLDVVGYGRTGWNPV